MATDKEFADFVMEQLRGVDRVSMRKMFGEYAVYAGDKIVALVADNQFYVKPTEAGRAILGITVDAPPYPQAKPWFLIEGELDDADFLARLIIATEREVPAPKPKKAKAAKKPAAKK